MCCSCCCVLFLIVSFFVNFIVLCIVWVQMCTVLPTPGVTPTAVNKYIRYQNYRGVMDGKTDSRQEKSCFLFFLLPHGLDCLRGVASLVFTKYTRPLPQRLKQAEFEADHSPSAISRKSISEATLLLLRKSYHSVFKHRKKLTSSHNTMQNLFI